MNANVDTSERKPQLLALTRRNWPQVIDSCKSLERFEEVLVGDAPEATMIVQMEAMNYQQKTR